MILLPSEQIGNTAGPYNIPTSNVNPFDEQSQGDAPSGIFSSDTSAENHDKNVKQSEVEHDFLPYPAPEGSPSPHLSRSITMHDQDTGVRPGSGLYGGDADPYYADPYYQSHRTTQNDPLLSNVPKEMEMGKMDVEDGHIDAKNNSFIARTIGGRGGNYPLQQRIENKKRGIGRQRYPFVVWLLTVVMISVFIYEMVLNKQQQGSPLSFKPTVNYMLGPSQSALIFAGARFPPCMKTVTSVPITLNLPCMNDTANPPDRLCPISELCGFGGIPPGKAPNQWFRFITPIFLHAGIIHLLLNMLAQMTISAQMEREMGSGGFLLVYFASGIFGNVMGGNFALVGVPSVGASGAIFGTVAVTWVDLFAHWKYHYKPGTRLIYMIVELIIGIGIGFIPFVDNFAHLGGFLMGLLSSTFFFPVISETKRHKAIMWAFRLAALPLAIVLFVVLIRNFYTSNPYAACKWCRYLSCIPTSANNRCQGTGITTTTVQTVGGNSVRELLFYK